MRLAARKDFRRHGGIENAVALLDVGELRGRFGFERAREDSTAIGVQALVVEIGVDGIAECEEDAAAGAGKDLQIGPSLVVQSRHIEYEDARILIEIGLLEFLHSSLDHIKSLGGVEKERPQVIGI